MDPQATQCPQCGSLFAVEPAAEAATCPACGAGLRISRGSSGHPLARPLEGPAPAAAAGSRPSARPAEALAARHALASQLRWRLQDLAAQRQKVESQIEHDTQAAAAGLRADQGNLITLATVGAVVGVLVSCLALLGTCNTLSARYNAADQFACSGIFCLLPPVVLTVAAWLYRRRLLSEEYLWHQRHSEGQQTAKRTYGPEIAKIDEETRSVEARLRELASELEDLAGQV